MHDEGFDVFDGFYKENFVRKKKLRGKLRNPPCK